MKYIEWLYKEFTSVPTTGCNNPKKMAEAPIVCLYSETHKYLQRGIFRIIGEKSTRVHLTTILLFRIDPEFLKATILAQ